MKYSVFTLALVLIFNINLVAQSPKASVSGSISDSAGKALKFATVELFRGAVGANPLASTFTSDKGSFSFNDLDTGSYVLALSHTGYAGMQHPFKIGNESKLDLGTVSLSAANSNLQGVVVTARKPIIEQTDDKIVFNVENDPASKTSTAIDLLRKTPFVSVDGEDNIQVNGQTNYKVLLNGKETAMFSQNPKEALKGFPGALIVKIEVITSPSAKYDAEGIGGIINIITKKKVAGYNGSVSAYTATTGWSNLNANLSGKFGKFGATMYYGANATNNFRGTVKNSTIPLVPNAAFRSRILTGNRVSDNFYNYGNLEMNYEVDSLTTISAYGNLSGGNSKFTTNQIIRTDCVNAGQDSVSFYDVYNRSEYPSFSLGSDLVRKFSKNKEKEFSLRLNSEFGNNNSYINSVMDNAVSSDRYVMNKSLADNKQYTIQSDYIIPMKPGVKLETGVKGIFRRAGSDFSGMIKSTSAEDYKTNQSNTDQFFYTQDIYGGYASYSFKWKKTNFRLGSRVEHTEVDGRFNSSKTRVKQSYTTIIPNLQATNKINDRLTMVLSYGKRLQRPYIFNLNPFRNDNDPRFISYGNPNLEPQIIHSLALQTRYSKGSTFAGITFTGSYSDNMIVLYSTFDPVAGVTTTTSGNFGKETGLNASGNINTKFNKDWTFGIFGNIRYSKVRNRMLPSQSNSGFGGNANMNTSYSVNKNLVISSYAGFFRAPVTIQTTYALNIWYGISAGYKVFKQKVTFTGSIANFLEKDREYRLITKDPAFRYEYQVTSPFRALSISLSYNFGKLTENVSKKKGVNNDDVISVSQ